jgi:hypothetical protein
LVPSVEELGRPFTGQASKAGSSGGSTLKVLLVVTPLWHLGFDQEEIFWLLEKL